MYDSLNKAVIDLEKFVKGSDKMLGASEQMANKSARLQATIDGLISRQEAAATVLHKTNFAITFKEVDDERLSVVARNHLIDVSSDARADVDADIKVIRAHTPNRG